MHRSAPSARPGAIPRDRGRVVCVRAAPGAADSTLTGMRFCRAERGAVCTFHGQAHWSCLHIPRQPGADRHARLPRGAPVIPDWSPLLHVLRSVVGVILTQRDLALGSPWDGGEVRITETERSECISAGRGGDRVGIAPRNAAWAGGVLFGWYAGYAEGMCGRPG